jgi:YVTN family beta-propeller protein
MSGGIEANHSVYSFASSGNNFFDSIYTLPTIYNNIAGPELAYVCHITENFVTVFDTKTNELIGKIPCGKGSDFVCFSSERKNGYISNYSSGNITVFDRKTNETITTVDAGEHPSSLLGIKNKVLITHESGDGIWILDIDNNTIVKKLQEGTGFLYNIENKNKIYQPQIFIPYLYVIDPVKLEIIKKIKTGGRPLQMAFTENKDFGYLTNYDYDEVTKFDTKTDNIVKHIKDIKHPRGIALSPDGKSVYVTNVIDGLVYIISTETDSITAVISGFKMPVWVTFNRDGKYAYVLNQAEATISIIDTKENNIVQTILVAGNPISIMIDNP